MKKILLLCVTLFTFTMAQFPTFDTTVSQDITISGDFETFLNVSDSDSLTNDLGYLGFQLQGENWNLGLNIESQLVNVEEANIRFGLFTVGLQPLPYGNAWALHRPSQSNFYSTPRMHDVQTGVLVGDRDFGIFYQNNDNYCWRIAPNFNDLLGIDTLQLGYSDSNAPGAEPIWDFNTEASFFNMTEKVQFEYVEDEILWYTTSLQWGNMVGLYGEMDDEALWGIGYKFGNAYLVYEDGESKRLALSVEF